MEGDKERIDPRNVTVQTECPMCSKTHGVTFHMQFVTQIVLTICPVTNALYQFVAKLHEEEIHD